MAKPKCFVIGLEIDSFAEVYFFEDYLIDPHLKFMHTDQFYN